MVRSCSSTQTVSKSARSKVEKRMPDELNNMIPLSGILEVSGNHGSDLLVPHLVRVAPRHHFLIRFHGNYDGS